MHRFHPYISYFARVDYRDDTRPFGILQHDRLMGMYLLGKTGSGKSHLLKLLLYQDLIHHRGCCLFDVNGDLFQEVLSLIPYSRRKDVVVLDVSSPSLGLGYNPLRRVSYAKRPLVASGILDCFQKLWGQQSWGLKLEYILRNTLLTLLDQPHATFDDIPRLLLDASFRETCMARVVSKNVRRFWAVEYPKYNKGDILPVLNKVGSFLSIPVLRKLLVENKTQISLRQLMDQKKIFLVNLSKGNLGSDGAHLLASLLLTSFALAGFSRVDTLEEKRVPFILFLDEFQNYTTLSLVEMLSELRKFKVGFVLAHQYMAQLEPKIREAVLGNIGTIICFRLGQADAKYMAQEFYPIFKTDDFINLENYHIYLKLLINGKVAPAFSAKTLTIRAISN